MEGLLFTTPRRVDINVPHLSDDDQALIRFCEKLEGEGQQFKEDIGLEANIEQALDYVSGRQLAQPVPEKRHRARVMANHIRSNLERKIGQLTDTVPQFLVNSRSGQTAAANTLRDTIKGIWTERSGQQFLTRSIFRAATAGFCPATVFWDKGLDFGLGDVSLDSLLPHQVTVDPYLRAAYALQDRAEYVIIKTLRPLSEFRELYTRGHLVRPEAAFSQYRNGREMEERGRQNARVYRRPSRQASPMLNGAIPRAIEYRCYFRDRTVDPLTPRTRQGTPNYLFPGKRLIIWSGNVPLFDGPQAYWDGLYPLEILDWGVEADHAYGESEVTPLTTLQAALNLLLSGIVDNARLVNNPPWVADEDALEPETEQELANYGDRAGWVTYKKPGSFLERNPPGEQSQVVFTTIRLLQGYLEQVMGVVDVIQGRQPGEVTSGVALESLATAAQITIRMQARAVENWLSRLGRLLISRIIQFYSDTRVLHAVNEWGEAQEFVFKRQEFLSSISTLQGLKGAKWQQAIQQLFRDLRFYVVEGSSLPGPRAQKTSEMTMYYKGQMVPRRKVLETGGLPNPHELIAEADREAVMLRDLMTPPPPPMPMMPQAQQRTPTLLQGGAGGRG